MSSAFDIQKRVIGALILREIHTRYGDRQFGYLWEIFEHVAHILVLVVLFTLLSRSPPIGDSFGVFFATGLIPFLLFMHITQQVVNAVNNNQPLLSYPMVLPLDLMVARALLECATTGVVIMLFLAVGFYFNLFMPVDSLLDIFIAFALIIPLGIGYGMVVALLKFYSPVFATLYSFLNRPLYFMSGLFYIADNLPIGVQKVLFFNPLLHINEWVRSGFYSTYESHFLDKYYVVSVSIVFLFIGLVVERLTKDKVRQRD
ncbi:MAG: ABC transporter permease [Gammaproteobacteria bacterium]